MKKINFSKAEKLLDKSLEDLLVQKLQKSLQKDQTISVEELQQLKNFYIELVSQLKKDDAKYADFGLSSDESQRLVEYQFEELDPADLNLVYRVFLAKKNSEKKLTETKHSENDEEIISTARKEHINKRHNIKKNWLPLK